MTEEEAEIRRRAAVLGGLLKQIGPPGVGMKSKFIAIEVRVREDAPTEVIEGITRSMTAVIKDVVAHMEVSELQGLVEFEVLNGSD